MATNKKSKTKKSATRTPVVVSKKAPEGPKLQVLSPSQFAGVLFLAVGFVYLVEYSRALREGAGSLACADYINQGDGYKCTELDVTMIRAKYYGGILAFLSIFFAMLLCWTEEHLFLRLNSFLCLSPLLSTIWALFTKRFFLGQGVVKIFMMACVLFVLAFSGARSASTLAQRKPLTATFQAVALLSFLLIHCKEAFLLLVKGVEGYVYVSDEGISSAAEVLVPFVAVDKLTLAALMAFVLFFFDENRQRVSSYNSTRVYAS